MIQFQWLEVPIWKNHTKFVLLGLEVFEWRAEIRSLNSNFSNSDQLRRWTNCDHNYDLRSDRLAINGICRDGDWPHFSRVLEDCRGPSKTAGLPSCRTRRTCVECQLTDLKSEIFQLLTVIIVEHSNLLAADRTVGTSNLEAEWVSWLSLIQSLNFKLKIPYNLYDTMF